VIFEYVENSHYNGIIILNKQNHHIFQQGYHLKLYVNDIEVDLINQGCQSYELKKIELIFINVC
jgi:hypothetical protein